MNVLVIGQGGREHALVRALLQSPSVHSVMATPGNSGIASEVKCLDIMGKENIKKIVDAVFDFNIDLVVIGPEVPLAEGLSDCLRSRGVKVFGPSQASAQLEASKIFAKQFMERAGVPTAAYAVVNSVKQTLKEAKEKKFSPPFILKADGLAGGKGVFICHSEEELESSARSLFEAQSLGEAGSKALLEEYLPGWELSFLVLTNGESFSSLPLTQDHKRLQSGDEGPNTGGMGVVGPLNIDKTLRKKIEDEILSTTVAQLKKENLLYRGVLYVGIMVTSQGPKVLEYNVRFGDPEAQVILPLLDGDWGQVMSQVAEGHLPLLKWKSLYCACVVLAAEGYPDHPKKGVKIEGNLLDTTRSDKSYFLHAGTVLDKNEWKTNGGRVLNAIGLGLDLKEAVEQAYLQTEKACWPGRQMRSDIGQKILGKK